MKRFLATITAVIAILGICGCAPHATGAAVSDPVMSASTPPDSPSPTADPDAAIALATCQASVASGINLSPDILTYTHVDVEFVPGDKKTKPFYSVSGYVNDISFDCLGIVVKDGSWNEHSYSVTVGGVETQQFGDF